MDNFVVFKRWCNPTYVFHVDDSLVQYSKKLLASLFIISGHFSGEAPAPLWQFFCGSVLLLLSKFVF